MTPKHLAPMKGKVPRPKRRAGVLPTRKEESKKTYRRRERTPKGEPDA